MRACKMGVGNFGGIESLELQGEVSALRRSLRLFEYWQAWDSQAVPAWQLCQSCRGYNGCVRIPSAAAWPLGLLAEQGRTISKALCEGCWWDEALSGEWGLSADTGSCCGDGG
jgi:hypothetical protein